MPQLKKIGLIIGPLTSFLLLWIDPAQTDMQSKVLAVAAWMLIWWVLESAPLYVTAMLPMVLFPLLGIMDVSATFIPYANPIIFLFLGGFVLALAMERRKLHERLAFGLLRVTGTKPAGIILGFMVSTAAVAMWISNTATAVMLLPIGLSVIQVFKQEATDQRLIERFALVLMLGIAYAANIGGMMTLIGTPPNLVFAGYYYEEFGKDFAFLEWLKIGVPIGIALLGLGFLFLTKFFYSFPDSNIQGAKQMISSRWNALGKMKKAERLVLYIFGFTVFLWVFANHINAALDSRILNNTSIAMIGAILMFVTPINWKQNEFIIDWKDTERLPWGILILFGGGLSLANALEQAGIIALVAKSISNAGFDHILLLMLGLTVLSLFLTEVMSNVALVTVLLPVVFGIGKALEVDAMLLTLPVTLAASCAFMMPISTPPNAVVYSSGFVPVKQMIRAGVWMNLIAVIVISLFVYLFYG